MEQGALLVQEFQVMMTMMNKVVSIIIKPIKFKTIMKIEKKLEDFQDAKKAVKKLDQIKGGGGGALSGTRVPSDA